DKYLALAHAGESAVWSERHLAQIIVVSHAGHHKILALGSSFRVWGRLAAMLFDPLLGLGGGAVVDGHLVPTLVLQVPRHRVAHDTQTQKRHLRHCVSPSLLLTSLGRPTADAYLPIGHCQGGSVNRFPTEPIDRAAALHMVTLQAGTCIYGSEQKPSPRSAGKSAIAEWGSAAGCTGPFRRRGFRRKGFFLTDG